MNKNQQIQELRKILTRICQAYQIVGLSNNEILLLLAEQMSLRNKIFLDSLNAICEVYYQSGLSNDELLKHLAAFFVSNSCEIRGSKDTERSLQILFDCAKNYSQIRKRNSSKKTEKRLLN